ncbi:LamG-like jellyroll fold domain-containing protein [Phenylobacterium sp.]|uniref:LamG-like jellyroll fold domain-containing protein n=1 Tax=Phenylobacterium sp. TaxID=1871053 RepID=UPI0035629445
MPLNRLRLLALSALAATAVTSPTRAAEPGLLFRLSADKGLTADAAAGDPVPNFADRAKIVPTGVKGGALSTADDVVLAWKAPGNIYAQRGTLSFFWRSRYPVGEAPFPLFRVGYADHTSWDMAWLRIDWNGSGFDAFVTDANLARTRVSFKLPKRPAPDAWTHLAFTWDETRGVELYIDGKLAAKQAAVAVYDSGLDQFGPTSRVVSPHQVQSRYNFMRGGDYDELRIYDHALSAPAIAALAKAEEPAPAEAPRDLASQTVRDEWRLRYGWNRLGDAPPLLAAPVTRIRKVEFADAKDLKEWMWKATDGIAETTWPGVYNRSRLPGRNDYLTLPDWNVYVEGGKRLTLTLPDEPWNHLEIQGAAYGDLTWGAGKIANRAQGQERTFNQFTDERRAGTLTFTNIAQETPIQEIAAYDLGAGAEPKGTTKLSYTIHASADPNSPDLDALNAFIAGRYPPEERATVVALPDGAPSRTRTADKRAKLPIVHILIPYEVGASPPAEPLYRSFGYGWENMHDALDGVAIDIPALKVKPTQGETFPLNIQIKDPIWPMRNLLDISVSVKPGEARTVWLDTRDRILPNNSLYLTFAGDGADFDAAQLDGARIRLVFKDRAAGLPEHVADRLNQVKDNWGFLVEEHTASKRESLYARVVADATDLLRVDPDNRIGREYWADIAFHSQGPLPFVQPTPPAGVPLWAFRQLEDLKLVHHFVDWWIDNRQVAYGDFGGGISDDTDLVEQWPGLALMGVEPERIRASHIALADSAYKNGMFTGGLSTIMTDELHSYEEGINSNSEAMYINWGDPKVVERLMTTLAAYDRIIQPNAAGHLHFKTSWFSGAKVFSEGPWEWGKDQSYLVLHPALLMAGFNGDPTAKKYVIGLADGILVHAKTGPNGETTWPDEINWRTDETRGVLPVNTPAMQLLWGAYRLSGDAKYLAPLIAAEAKGGTRALTEFNENLLDVLGKRADWGPEAVKRGSAPGASNFDRYLAWQAGGDKRYLEDLYGEEIRTANQRMYTQTEGHWWSDRVEVPSELLQRSRLGGVALKRNWIWPGATVSWRFDKPEAAEQVAILVPGATPNHFKVIAYNTADRPVTAVMTGWNVTSGEWRMTSGVDADGDDRADAPEGRTVALWKSGPVNVTFAPRRTTVLDFTLATPGPQASNAPDLGIGAEDVIRKGRNLSVTVHSLGDLDASAGEVTLEDATGKIVARAATPPLKAPKDLKPKTATVNLALPPGFDPKDARVRVVLRNGGHEITQLNNSVELR